MDNELFERLYNAFYMRVYSFLITLTKDASLAEELTQETFYKALTSRSSFRNESKEITWLCAIAKNLYTDEMRKMSKYGQLPKDRVSDINVESAVLKKDDALRIHFVIHSLPEPYREVFELRVFGELSFKEIGVIFSKTENWARVTYHRAKIQIQERLADDYEI